jgi:hypothetical protein
MNASIKKSIKHRSYKGLLYEYNPSERLFTWEEAVDYVQNLKKESRENWRLPTVEELQKLFTKENKKYLRSFKQLWSRNQEDSHTAWVMDLEQNLYYLRDKNYKFRVLCVQDTILKRSIKFF